MKSKITLFLVLFCVHFTASAQQLNPDMARKILERFPEADRDGDGKLSKSEAQMLQKQIIKRYPKADANDDGKLSKSEMMRLAKALRDNQADPNKPAATHANVKYGDHERHVLDIWIADGAANQPAPLALYIHGGGFGSGSKEKMKAEELVALLNAGVSVAAINYRYKTTDPLPAAFYDSKQALQFIRSKASEWDIDKDRVAVFGSSAGAQICMWLAYSDEMADPTSTNPIERESTRVTCVSTRGGQTTMEEQFWTNHVAEHGGTYDPQPRLDTYVGDTLEEVNEVAISLAALTLISSDDPPIYMSYSMTPEEEAPPIGDPSAQGWVVHHVVFGLELEDLADTLGVETHLVYPGTVNDYNSHVDFMVKKLIEE